jgi:RNA polymerase sigma factor (sigma-70 family)
MGNQKLIEDNLPLADLIALEYANIPGSSVDDARSEAHIALMRAADAYDSEKGEFIHFASRVMRNALNSLYAKQLRYSRIFPKSLEDPVDWGMLRAVNATGGSSEQLQPSDPKQNVLKEVRRQETLLALGAVLNLLSPRERLLVDALVKGSSYAEIGENFGVTKQAAHKAVKSGLAKLREGLARMGYRGLASDGHLGSGEKNNSRQRG